MAGRLEVSPYGSRQPDWRRPRASHARRARRGAHGAGIGAPPRRLAPSPSRVLSWQKPSRQRENW